jgi:hypothetical protein
MPKGAFESGLKTGVGRLASFSLMVHARASMPILAKR